MGVLDQTFEGEVRTDPTTEKEYERCVFRSVRFAAPLRDVTFTRCTFEGAVVDADVDHVTLIDCRGHLKFSGAHADHLFLRSPQPAELQATDPADALRLTLARPNGEPVVATGLRVWYTGVVLVDTPALTLRSPMIMGSTVRVEGESGALHMTEPQIYYATIHGGHSSLSLTRSGQVHYATFRPCHELAFEGCRLLRCALEGVQRLRVRESLLHRCALEGLKVEAGLAWESSDFDQCNVGRLVAPGAVIQDCTFVGCELQGSRLTQGKLEDVVFHASSSFQGLNVQGSVLLNVSGIASLVCAAKRQRAVEKRVRTRGMRAEVGLRAVLVRRTMPETLELELLDDQGKPLEFVVRVAVPRESVASDGAFALLTTRVAVPADLLKKVWYVRRVDPPLGWWSWLTQSPPERETVVRALVWDGETLRRMSGAEPDHFALPPAAPEAPQGVEGARGEGALGATPDDAPPPPLSRRT